MLALLPAMLAGCGDEAAPDGDAGVGVDLAATDVAVPIARPVRGGEVHCRLGGTRAGALPRAELIGLSGEPIVDAVAVAADGDDLLVATAGATIERLVFEGRGYTVERAADLGARGRLRAMVRHPDPARAQLFVHLLPDGEPRSSVIARLTIDPQTGLVDPGSELSVLQVEFRGDDRHGGGLAFDADGMLLIALGDGGDGGQMYRDSMDATVLPGKLLRIDVDAIDTQGSYAIPLDNPFAMGGGERPEIYAMGLRDPRGCAVAPADGAIYCSDQGEQRTELNRMQPGDNHGWPERDGVLCVATQQLCLDERYATPEAMERHVEGRCAGAGLAFQSAPEPAPLLDVAVHGDACDPLISGLAVSSGTAAAGVTGTMVRGDVATAALGVGPGGALIVVDAAGALFELGLAGDGVPGTFPERLSETGCYGDLPAFEPAADLIEFRVNSPLWTDGAHKRRWMVVPAGETIAAPETGPWTFPRGTILVKEFALQFGDGAADVRPVETRFMVKRDVGWEFYAYRWNDEGTDGELVSGDHTASYDVREGGEARSLDYQFPGPATCPVCHSAAPGRPLGPRTEQLNRVLPYEDGSDNQLSVLRDAQLIAMEGDVEGDDDLERLPRLPDPADGGADLELRVRSYLHSNCAHCHQPEGWSSPSLTMDLRYELSLEDTRICDVDTQFLARRPKRIAPGDPDSSSVLGRMLELDTDRMPPVATTVVDPLAVALLTEWIEVVQCL